MVGDRGAHPEPEASMELTREIRDKRIAVAKDVLLQFDRADVPLQLCRANGYVVGSLGVGLHPEDDVRDHADVIQAECHVCQKGALLLSKARLFDAVPLSTVLWNIPDYTAKDGTVNEVAAFSDEVNAALADLFDRLTMDMLEVAFERSASVIDLVDKETGDDIHDDRGVACLSLAALYGKRFADDRGRVRACMENLIINDGEFRVPGMEDLA
jgi:hypothetical protein